MNLNLSKFKKVKDGKDATILKHPSGHHFVIAKKALSPEMHKQIEDLPMHFADGGMASSKYFADASDASSEQESSAPKTQPTIVINTAPQPAPQAAPQPAPQAAPDPEKDPYEGYLNPGVYKSNMEALQSPSVDTETKNKILDIFDDADKRKAAAVAQKSEQEKSFQQRAAQRGIMPSPQAAPEVPMQAPAQAPVAPQMPASPAGQPDMASAQAILQDPNVSEAMKNEVRASMGMPSTPAAGIAPEVPHAPNASGAPAPQYNTQSDPYGLKTAESSINQQISATQKIGDIQSEQSRESAKLYQGAAFDEGQRIVEHQLHEDELTGEVNSVVKDQRDGYIKPNQYLANMSTGQKVMTAIGLALGGFSNAINHTGNPAMEFLKGQIDNDIKSQIENRNTRTDLLKAFENQYGVGQKSFELYKAARYGILQDQLAQQVAKSGDPMAQQNAALHIAELGKAKSELLRNASLMQSMMGGSTNNGGAVDPAAQATRTLQMLRVTNNPMAKDYETRLVPHVGLADIPVPEKVRDKIISGQNLMQKLTNLEAFAKKNGGSLDPAIIAQGKTMAALAQNQFRDATGQGVFKENDQKFIESMIKSDPTAWFGKLRTLPRYKVMIQNAREELNGTLGGYGLPVLPDFSQFEGAPKL